MKKRESAYTYRGKHYKYIAVDRMTGNVMARSNDFKRICRTWRGLRYDIELFFDALPDSYTDEA